MSRLLAAAAVALLAFPAPADDALLQTVRAANRASVEAVKTWRGTVTFQSKRLPDPGRLTGEFVRDGDKIRSRTTRRGQDTTTVRTGAARRVLVLDPAAPGDVANYGEVHAQAAAPDPGDPWECGLLGFEVEQGNPARPHLDAWLAHPGVKPVGADRATHAGRPVVRITATRRDGYEEEFDLDPAAGHLVRAYRVKNDSPRRRDGPPTPLAGTAEVTEFREAKPGVWVPVAATAAGTAEGQPVGYDWSAAGVAVNEPVPADTWELPFPAGLRVVDDVKQGVFRTDAAGQPGDWARTPAGQPYAYAGRVPPEVAAAAPPPPPAATPLDPTVVWPLALVAVVVLAAVAVVVVGLGRRRK